MLTRVQFIFIVTERYKILYFISCFEKIEDCSIKLCAYFQVANDST